MGALINTAAIIAGGLIGMVAGHAFGREQQEALSKACGVSVLFIAIAGAMEGMLRIEGGLAAGAAMAADGAMSAGAAMSSGAVNGLQIVSGRSMLVVLCLAAGTLVGELIGIERGFVTFGEWLKVRTGNSGDAQFVNAFVTASLTVCIGAMAIVGSIQDGVTGDYSTLAVKSVLDLIIVAVMTSSLGKGAAFSAIPILLFEGSITLLAHLIAPLMTEAAIAYLSLIGSVLIFCVGLNLVFGRQLRVANMLPAVAFAVAAAYLPWQF